MIFNNHTITEPNAIFLLKVLFGGGLKNFLPQNETSPKYGNTEGYRSDNRNLVKVLFFMLHSSKLIMIITSKPANYTWH